jgi:hypothetical protein
MFAPDSCTTPPTGPAESDAYIPVRVPDPARADGSQLVYLPDGTGLVVDSRSLVRPQP